METGKKLVAGIALVVVLVAVFAFTPSGRRVWNNWMGDVQRADDETRYSNQKQVEDTCRAMIASYESDTLTYEQYRASPSTEKQNWAAEALMRANKTAASYNEYILKNSFVWEGNVPKDIRQRLEYLTDDE